MLLWLKKKKKSNVEIRRQDFGPASLVCKHVWLVIRLKISLLVLPFPAFMELQNDFFTQGQSR